MKISQGVNDYNNDNNNNNNNNTSFNDNNGFDSFFVLTEGIPIFSHTNFALHRLVRLTLLYYSLICKVIYDSPCSFLFKVFSILCFLMMVG